MTPAARIAAAVALLEAVEATPQRPADATANDFFRARRYIGSGDRRAVAERAWGVVRQRLRLEWWLRRTAPGGQPTPRRLLAAHLLLAEGWNWRGVEEAFPGGRFNAEPLDAAERAALKPLAGAPPVHPEMPEHVRLNLPEWVLPAFRDRFGDRLAEEAAAMERPAPLDLRANLLRTTREAAAASLAAEGIATEPTPFSPWGLRLRQRRPITGTAAFREGLVEVQDEGSQLIALLADARPGMRVADFCAGAGGKTLAMAATMRNKGRLVACDVSAVRLEGAVRRLRRAGVDNAERHLLEPGDRWGKRRQAGFDRVLVDAPCTGTGTWRRNPDARLRTGPGDLAELSGKQGKILDSAADLVRPGGRLVYATCSILPEEDEGQMDAFLGRRPDYAPVPLAALWPALCPGVPSPETDSSGPYLVTSPGRHGTDGFFAAVLERQG
ncbi:RsmB/NOP family class I SAM-dependent RNA methyltransferase [Roseomonas sp. NAR14]|uniref:RsmB/NOP family class I SAM-dependent RNA methyltransferase n=1 Tax=Roseomonas acroporae TaxID=2937791 RepID=A0A9X1YCG0_9PROT|nr:RsmB/NOP family class I SAM-dependent RNA methyltransferase [Roseomonas acroporae]MCK8787222.1 RsmB/NOP family class I SAM-dependent RNA methyltransferase [Roseomonas acroporae]